jgi:surface polysaccharide O-acyltransferase-like enzyme
MFVVISGAILLNTSQPVLDFYKFRATRLLPPIAFWSIFYIFYSIYTQGITNEMVWNLKNDIVAKGKTYYHLWYLSMFFCLMLFVPYLGRFLNGLKPTSSEVKILIGLCACFFILNFFSSIILNVYEIEIFWFKIFPSYIVYLIAGHYIHVRMDALDINNKLLIIVTSISTSIILFGVFGNYMSILNFNIIKDYFILDNTGPFVLFITLSIFLIFRKLSPRLPDTLAIRKISDATFGIYLIHPVFIDITDYCLKFYTKNLFLILILQILLTAMLSFITINAIRKYHLIRKFC